MSGIDPRDEGQPAGGPGDPGRQRDLTTADLADAAAPSPDGEPRSFRGEGEDPDAAKADPAADARPGPLFDPREVESLRADWTAIQGGFVDEPRRAVEDADRLVADAMKRLAEMFAKERSSLEAQWDRGDQVSTEDLRVALQRYRAFFDRLLSV